MSESKDFEELFTFLNAHHVKAIVVGGHAVAFHAKPRYTKDIDVFVERSSENATRLMAALVDFGFGDVGLSAADFEKPGKIIQLGVAPNRIDLLTSIDGVEFSRAWDGKSAGRYGEVPIFYLGKAELIANKRASGRPQDLADVSVLEEEP